MPFTEEEYALLRGGPEGIAKWNALRRGKDREGVRPTLWQVSLFGLDLRRVDLSWANMISSRLENANLQEANLSEADLSVADLSGANLKWGRLDGACFNGASLTGANLHGAMLGGADLRRANLSRTDLSRANLTRSNLTNALLCGADLSHASIGNALLNWTDMTEASVEDALVRDVVIHELRGIPKPPRRLWLELKGRILTGADAANFFVLPAVVEVYLTQTLNEKEAGLLQVQHGAVHAYGEARDVYLMGHRRECEGSVLRFQGPTYDAVYAALPDLLAPFRTAAAIDWKVTLADIPKDVQPGALMALAEAAFQDRRQRWPIAKKLAQVFDAFAHAEVRELKEGRSQGMVIKVATSKAMLQRLDPPTPGSMTLVVRDQGRLAIIDKGEVIEMGDNINVKAGAISNSNFGSGNTALTGGNSTAEANQTTSPELTALADVVNKALQLLADTPLRKADREQAEKHVEDIQAEAAKTLPDPEAAGKIKGWLDSLTKLCEPAAKMIAGAKVVIDALGLGG